MRTRRLSILYVVEYFPPHIGGSETLLGNSVAELVRRGHQVSVVTLAVEGAVRREIWNGASVFRVWTPRIGDRYWFMLLALWRAIRLGKSADVIHTTTVTPVVPAWVTARLNRKPCVVTVHEVFGRSFFRFFGMSRLSALGHTIFEAALYRIPFDYYVCVSEYTRGCLQRVARAARGRTAVAHPPIDYDFWLRPRTPRPLREELGLPDDCFVYLYFGRPGLSKGVEDLIDAAQRVRDAVPNSRLVLLLAERPAPQRRTLIRRIAESGLEDHVVVLPLQPREELPRCLLAADCIVSPSQSEGFGYAAAESATIGCRVIATSGHALDEAVGGHATFVPPRDPAALGDAIISMAAAKDSPRPQPMEPRFTTTAHVDVLEQVYERVTADADSSSEA